MTSRERVIATLRGGEVDRKPTFGWPKASDSDVIALDAASLQPDSERIVLGIVRNPFGRALEKGLDLNALHRESPEEGDAATQQLVSETRAEMEQVLAAGADGVLYLVHGAHPAHCSPMQFGGFYLEVDRELLQGVAEAAVNAAFIVGDAETYLDFVSDLPASFLIWDDATTGFSVAQMRALRSGPLGATSPDADLVWASGLSGVTVAQFLEGNGALAHA